MNITFFPTRDASPPLVLAFGAWVRSHVCVLPYGNKKNLVFHLSQSPPKNYIAICLHSTLFVCTALIINALRSVDNPVFCMHAVWHLSALICTYLHSSARCMHLSAHPSLRTSAPNCTTVIPPTQFGIGEADFWLERPKNLPPVIILTAPHRHYVMLLWQRKQRKN